MAPFFSVVIALYNKENYIEATLNSVLNQTFKDFEVIVVNDGSTDNSLKIVENLSNDKITIYNNKNNGLSFSRNYGINKAKANFIAFLDADDLWFEDFLQTIYNLIVVNKEHSVFTTSTKTLKPKNNNFVALKSFHNKYVKFISNYKDLTKYIINFSAIVIHKKVFNDSGYFDNEVNYAEDEDFLIRCFTNYNIIYYTEPKAYYRIGYSSQLTSPNPDFKRKIANFENYLTFKNEKTLRPYLDFIHFKLVLLYKMEWNKERVRFYKQKISVKNLTSIQKIKLKLPIWAFYYSKIIYLWLSKRSIQS
jgi:glycosyltransferase involved in cell wall biosynthesis